MPCGYALLRDAPMARPKRDSDPSATTTYRARISSTAPVSLRLTTAPRTRPFSHDRRGGLGLIPHRGAGLLGVLGHEVIEVVARDDVAVGREVGVLGPAHLERVAERERPQPVVAVVLGERVGQAHVVELFDGPRGEPVAAGLLPRVVLALDHDDVMAGFGQPVRGGCSRRPPTDDEDVGGVRHYKPSRSYVDDGGDFLFGQLALERRHATAVRDALAAFTVGIAVALALERCRARVDPADVVVDHGEGLDGLAAGQLGTDAAVAVARRGTTRSCCRTRSRRRRPRLRATGGRRTHRDRGSPTAAWPSAHPSPTPGRGACLMACTR